MSAAANKLPRQMLCTCCSLIKLRKGCKTVPGSGLVCAECVTELPTRTSAPEIVKAPPAPRYRSTTRPRPTITAPWTPRETDKPATPPAEPAVAPSVVRTLPPYDPRYGVDPSSVTPMFSALGIGRYLPEGETA
jgi:hypothetical protein